MSCLKTHPPLQQINARGDVASTNTNIPPHIPHATTSHWNNGKNCNGIIDFRTIYQMPAVMLDHWKKDTKVQRGARDPVSFADVIRQSPEDVAGVIVSTFSLSL